MRGRLALSNYVDYVCHSHLTEISFGYYWCSFHISRKAAMVTGCCTIRDLASVMNCIINCWKRYTDGCGKGSHSGNRWRCWYLVLRKYVIGYPPDVFFCLDTVWHRWVIVLDNWTKASFGNCSEKSRFCGCNAQI